MKKRNFMDILEAKLMPMAAKISGNVHLSSIRDGFALAMPLLIIGSMFMLISNFPIQAWIDLLRNTEVNGNTIASYFSAATNASFTIMSIFVVIGIGNAYGSRIKVNALFSGVVSLVAWFILMPFEFDFTPEDGKEALKVSGLSLDWLGAKGVFIGIITAFVAVRIYKMVVDRGLVIKMPAGVPPTVGESFASLFPATFVMATFVIIKFIFSLTPWENAFSFVYSVLQLPLQHVGGSLPAIILVYLFAHVLWFLGIHGTNITDSVFMPVLYALSAENLAKVNAGLLPENIINVQFQNLFATFGGAGSTLSLLIVAVLISKSKRLKQLSSLSILPAVFGINEPVIYGLPIVLNPLLLIPFIFVPMINIIITYITMSIGLVPITNGIIMPWTTPPVISGFLSSNWQGAVLQVFLIVLGCIIYYPFVVAVDKNNILQEENLIKENKEK
ncbi:PTS sugar transporter subunit IIC [Anaerococcus tetradius]|uniref:Permease IIC component n=1 Tax=Anaerococcus tetradius ATCC 35098 TaxID=525255 RepID=C2CHT0_9FIRM|nr:PTS transporter subunit EIIC [Anaerococcus tetradius]EEI82855.1 putative PTS system, cellobiose-specific IIC component [Anaerococcus tetradius ATCC 35098]